MSTVRPCVDKERNYPVMELREHDQRDQRRRQQQEAGARAAGTVAEVTLAAFNFSTDDRLQVRIVQNVANLPGSAALADLHALSPVH